MVGRASKWPHAAHITKAASRDRQGQAPRTVLLPSIATLSRMTADSWPPSQRETTAMKHFGIVQSFNEATGHGFIRPEEGGEHLRFARNEILWDPMVSPRPGVRLSYRLPAGMATPVPWILRPCHPPSGRRERDTSLSARSALRLRKRRQGPSCTNGTTRADTWVQSQTLVSVLPMRTSDTISKGQPR